MKHRGQVPHAPSTPFEVIGCIRVELKTDILKPAAPPTPSSGWGAVEEGVLRHHVIVEGGRIPDHGPTSASWRGSGPGGESADWEDTAEPGADRSEVENRGVRWQRPHASGRKVKNASSPSRPRSSGWTPSLRLLVAFSPWPAALALPCLCHVETGRKRCSCVQPPWSMAKRGAQRAVELGAESGWRGPPGSGGPEPAHGAAHGPRTKATTGCVSHEFRDMSGHWPGHRRPPPAPKKRGGGGKEKKKGTRQPSPIDRPGGARARGGQIRRIPIPPGARPVFAPNPRAGAGQPDRGAGFPCHRQITKLSGPTCPIPRWPRPRRGEQIVAVSSLRIPGGSHTGARPPHPFLQIR